MKLKFKEKHSYIALMAIISVITLIIIGAIMYGLKCLIESIKNAL